MGISAENLREGQQILIRGKVSFSRLAQLIDGQALVERIAQARQRGTKYPTLRPHTTISLLEPQVLVANPAGATPEEQFVHEKIFAYKTGDNAGKMGYTIDNVSSYLPTVLEADPENPGKYRQLVLERDLASGVDVTLVLQVFRAKDHEKRGIGLQQVVLNEPVRYYASSGVDTSALQARGIVVTGPIRAVAAADSPAAAAGAAVQPFAQGADAGIPANSQVDSNGFAAPVPGMQGIAPAPSLSAQMFPQAAPVAQAPVAQVPVVQAPVAQVAPAAAAAAVETPEQQIARLQQQIAEQNAAMSASGGGSAFNEAALVGAGAPVAEPGPWDVAGQPATYQG